MVKYGLLIPCDKNSEIAIFDNVFCDIGDEQSIEQSLSSFSAHMTKVINILDKFEYLGNNETIDTYYYDPLRVNLKPNSNNQINECLRLRTKDNVNSITYKVDKFDEDGKWLYSDEYET